MSQKPFQKSLNKTLLRSNKLFPAIQRNNDKNVHVLPASPKEVNDLGSEDREIPSFFWKEYILDQRSPGCHYSSMTDIKFPSVPAIILLLSSRLGFLMERNKYFLQMKGKPHSLSRFGGHPSAIWYNHSHKAAWDPVPLQGFRPGQYFGTKVQPLHKSPESHTHHSKSPWPQTHGSDTTVWE